MADRKIVMVFLDAFSSRYLNADYCPFFHKMCKKGNYKFIDPLFAFEGIGATIFSGTWPRTHGVWTNFIAANQFLSKIDSLMCSSFKIFDKLPNDRLRWDSRYLVYNWLRKPIPIPNLISPSLLNFFEHKQEKPIYLDNALNNVPTIFEILKRNGKTVTFFKNSAFMNDKKITELLCNYFKNGKISDLTYLKISSLDPIGHKYGPASKEILNAVRTIDNLLMKMVMGSLDLEENITFLFFSDHGMVPVSKTINISELMRKTSLKIGTDFLMFLDSTMARFWAFNQKAHDVIKKLLLGIRYGHILSSSELQTMKLPVNRDEFGEMIFALDEGVMVHPDFFHKDNIKGMHGYYNTTYDNPFFALSSLDDIRLSSNQTIEFVDIVPTVLDLLQVSPPPLCEGKSIIRHCK